jgi:F0F1-type ATP synthase assembly protein I
MHKGNEPPGIPQLVRMADVLRLLGFGWYFATCLGLGAGGGAYLDHRLGTGHWILMAGLLLGTVAGFYGMFKMLSSVYKPRGGNDGRGSDGE